MAPPKDDQRQETGDLNDRPFEQQATEPEMSLLSEFRLFLKENKKWWLIPLIASLLLLGLVSWLAASGAAPFIYTLF